MNIFESIWTYVAAGVGIMASIVTIISFKKKRKKELSILLLVNIQTVYVPESLVDKIKVRFNNKETNEVWRVVFVIGNSGKIPIEASDFEGSITISFEKDIELFDLSLDDKSPTTLNAEVVKSSNGFSIKPTLFNSTDLITINAYVNKKMRQVQIQGRIKGIKNFKFRNECYLDERREKRVRSAIIILIVGACYFFATMPNALSSDLTKSFFSKWIFPLGGFVLFLIGIIIFFVNHFRREEITYRILRANKWINVDDSIIKF